MSIDHGAPWGARELFERTRRGGDHADEMAGADRSKEKGAIDAEALCAGMHIIEAKLARLAAKEGEYRDQAAEFNEYTLLDIARGIGNGWEACTLEDVRDEELRALLVERWLTRTLRTVSSEDAHAVKDVLGFYPQLAEMAIAVQGYYGEQDLLHGPEDILAMPDPIWVGGRYDLRLHQLVWLKQFFAAKQLKEDADRWASQAEHIERERLKLKAGLDTGEGFQSEVLPRYYFPEIDGQHAVLHAYLLDENVSFQIADRQGLRVVCADVSVNPRDKRIVLTRASESSRVSGEGMTREGAELFGYDFEITWPRKSRW